MGQEIVVYVIIGAALVGLLRHLHKKLRAFRRKDGHGGCEGCAFKDECDRRRRAACREKGTGNGCCS